MAVVRLLAGQHGNRPARCVSRALFFFSILSLGYCHYNPSHFSSTLLELPVRFQPPDDSAPGPPRSTCLEVRCGLIDQVLLILIPDSSALGPPFSIQYLYLILRSLKLFQPTTKPPLTFSPSWCSGFAIQGNPLVIYDQEIASRTRDDSSGVSCVCVCGAPLLGPVYYEAPPGTSQPTMGPDEDLRPGERQQDQRRPFPVAPRYLDQSTMKPLPERPSTR
eukprot:g2896.t1